MASVGIALVGAGPWGLILARAFSRVADVDLRWICEVDDDRRARAGTTHPGTRLTPTVDEALADPEVTAVAVAVDSARHHPVGLRVLGANRHLLLEKPMALSVAGATELLALANARARVLTVGHLLLHHPAVRRARRLVADGVLGQPLYFESTRTTPGAPKAQDSAWWALAPHDVSLALHFFDAVPVVVSATGGGYRQPDHDGVASASLRFADGRTAHIHVARFAAIKQRRFSVAGTKRTLTFDELGGDRPLVIRESPGSDASPTEAIPVDAVDPLVAQCQHFVSCVVRDDLASGNGHHALDVVRVLDAGARSMRAGGTPVEIS